MGGVVPGGLWSLGGQGPPGARAQVWYFLVFFLLARKTELVNRAMLPG